MTARRRRVMLACTLNWVAIMDGHMRDSAAAAVLRAGVTALLPCKVLMMDALVELLAHGT